MIRREKQLCFVALATFQNTVPYYTKYRTVQTLKNASQLQEAWFISVFRATLLPCPSSAWDLFAHCAFQLYQTLASASKPRETDLLVGSHDTFLINGKMLPDEIPGLQTQANISNTRNFQTLQATTSVVTAVFALPAYQTNSFTQPSTWITPVQFVHHIRTQSRTALKGQRELYPNIGPSCPSLTPPRQSCCSRHISIHAGRAWLGDGCMHAASSRDVCLQLCWAPCSSRDLQKTFILHILQTDVPSPQGLRGVARKKWQ